MSALPSVEADRLDELLATIIDEYNTIREVVRALNPPRPQLQVLSVGEYVSSEGKNRWVNLTQAVTTVVDDEFLEALARLCNAYEEIGGRALALAAVAPPPLDKVIITTYYRGKASVNFITMNLASRMLTVPPQHALAELSIIVACASQLVGLLRAGTGVVVGAEGEGGKG